MDSWVLTFGQIAGIGGLALGVLLLIFRDVIRKNIFPKFKDEQLAFRLLRMIVGLTWSVAIIGIVAWVGVGSGFVSGSGSRSGALVLEGNEISGNVMLAQGDMIVQEYNQYFQTELDEETRQLILRASNLAEAGLQPEALAAYEGLLAQADLPAVRANLGALQLLAGDAAAARTNLVEALAADPSSEPARLALAQLEAQEGRYDEAIQHLSHVSGADARALADELRERESSGAYETEPNGERSLANEIGLASEVQGAARPDEVDYFAITLPAGNRDLIDVHLKSLSPEFGPGFRILDSEGEQILDQAASTRGQDLSASFSGNGAARYFVEVSDRAIGLRQGPGGSYLLRLEPRNAFDEFEPNDTDDEATPISLGTAIEANIMDRDDIDVYRLRTGPAQDSLRLQLSPISSPDLRPRITLIDAASNSRGFTAGAAGAGIDQMWAVQTGSEYVVRIAPYTRNGGEYRLLLREDGGGS